MLHSHRKFTGGRVGKLLALAATLAVMASAAHATTFVETTDFSNDGTHPTVLGTLTPGNNIITGTINSTGTVVGSHGELSNPDPDYVTFTVPVGYVLSQFIVANGTNIQTSPRVDSLLLGLAAGSQTTVNPLSTSAAGLLGWTLVTQALVGTDILAAIGASAPPNFPPFPGAATFTGPLGAGSYTLFLSDGDTHADYSFDVVVASVPEPGTWAMMLLGFGGIGIAMRRKRTAVLARA